MPPSIHYIIKSKFAKKTGKPYSFNADIIKSTNRAMYLKGHLTLPLNGRWVRCGSELRHPGSKLLGIGQDCLHDLGGAKIDLTKINPRQVQAVHDFIRSQPIIGWFPKRVILRRSPVYNALQTSGMPSNQLSIDYTSMTPAELDTIQIKGLLRTPYPFQLQGVAFMQSIGGRGMIADEMGLGKTAQALMWAHLNKNKRPIIIICPASLKLSWALEAQFWLPGITITVLEGKKGEVINAPTDLMIINYDILSNEFQKELLPGGRVIEKELYGTGWVDHLKKIKAKGIILDESHKIKSPNTRRTHAVQKLQKNIPHIIALSGTPIVSRPVEFYTVLKMIAPKLIPNYWTFVKRYCGAKDNGFGLDVSGSSNVHELHDIVSKVMIRRLKKDVLKELPEKVRAFIPLEINNRREYEEAENNFIEYVDRTKGEEAAERASNAKALTQIEVLKQLAAKGKLDAVISWVEDILESGEKLVVCAVHKEVISHIYNRFKLIAVKIDGTVPPKHRKSVEQTFQLDDKIKICIIQYGAGGVGFTLTASSNVACVEYPWTPGELEQAIDRTHRIGQKYSVTAHYLFGKNTIEEAIIKLLAGKEQVLNQVLDGAEIGATTIYSEIIKTYTT